MIDSELSSAENNPYRAPRRQFRLTGKSLALDRATLAVRRDLADIALADRVFAPHYANAVKVEVAHATEIRRLPIADAEVGAHLVAGDVFDLLDLGTDWAWGRGQAPGSVGYVRCDALMLK